MKNLSIFVASLFFLSLVACGPSQEDQSQAEQEAKEAVETMFDELEAAEEEVEEVVEETAEEVEDTTEEVEEAVEEKVEEVTEE